MSFEAVVEFNDEGMVEHCHNRLLVLDDIFFLIFADEAFQHYFHGIELPISQTPYQIDLAEASNGQTLADFISLETALSDVLQTVEGCFSREDALTDRDLIVQKDVLIDGFEPYYLCGFQ